MAEQPNLDDLPPEVAEVIRPHLVQDDEMLAAIGVALDKRFQEAKAARTEIEETWTACEEAYAGIDAANRGESDRQWQKGMTPSAPLTSRNDQPADHRSTVFVPITARYVDAATAKLGEILLPPDDKAFSFTETPEPDLVKAKEDTRHVHTDDGVPLYRPAKPGELKPEIGPDAAPVLPGAPAPVPAPAEGAVPPAGAAAPGMEAPPEGPPPGQVPLLAKDLAEEKIELARKKAKRAEQWVYDRMVECQRTEQVRKVIFDSARIGVGILKGPVPKVISAAAVTTEGESIRLEYREKVAPASEWVNPWNFYPDPACGERVADGNYSFEVDHLSESSVLGLKKLPGYIASQIDKVIAEGPDKVNLQDNDGTGRPREQKKDRYQIRYYHGTLSGEDMDCIMRASRQVPEKDARKNEREVSAVVTTINDSVIRATINPLDSNESPYNNFPWRRRVDSWSGVGIPEQMDAAQKIANAATRAMLNNAGKSAGSQIVVDRALIRPANGDWTMTPDKVWETVPDAAGITDLKAAFQIFEIPNATPQLMSIIEYALKLAEESTSIPLITQGQSGKTTPDTLGATQLQDNNANQLLRSLGYGFDEFVTEREVRGYYRWYLLDPDVPNEDKGDFQINAHGSAALIERALQEQFLPQLLAVSKDPAYGANPRKTYKMVLKSKRIDPAEVTNSPEEQAKIDAQPAPAAPQIEVAKIRAQVDTQKIQVQQQTAQTGAHIEAARLELDEQKAGTDATVRLHTLEVQRELAMLEYANRERVNLAQVKKDLAKTAMEITAEKQLNAANNAVTERQNNQRQPRRQRGGGKPAVQAPGRARNGHAADQTVPS